VSGQSGRARLALGHYALKPELAGMAEHYFALPMLKVLIQAQAGSGLRQHAV
jgi:hypothetical protein